MKRKDSIFTEVPVSKTPQNFFDLSHEVKTSAKFGYLYPMLVKEALPGDVWIDTATIMIRFAPMLAPLYHRVQVISHFFFVPYRLLSDHWEDFITGGRLGDVGPTLPYITPAGVAAAHPANMAAGTLWDHMGLPIAPAIAPGVWSNEQISVFPFWAYDKIYNDWYKDPNFEADIAISTELQGDVSVPFMSQENMFLRRKGWRKDYFTSALAEPQRGAEVLMPIAGIADAGDISYLPTSSVEQAGGGLPSAPGALSVAGGGGLQDSTAAAAQLRNIAGVAFTNSEITINDLRVALATQAWLEAQARGGYRYIDTIEAQWNVRVPDYRLQRCEYLGGGRQPVRVSEVLSTTASGPGGPAEERTVGVGWFAGQGMSVGKTNRFRYRCQEYGIVMGIFTVVPDTAYQQGLDRMWTRKTKFDYPWPKLAHLGEQAILSKELFFSFDNADNADNQLTFGYTPRYSEWKFQNDVTTGDMRTTLDFWTLTRIFTARPVLDEDFTTINEQGIENDEESMRRIFQVEDSTDYLWVNIFHRLSVSRKLPYFGVPKLVG